MKRPDAVAADKETHNFLLPPFILSPGEDPNYSPQGGTFFVIFVRTKKFDPERKQQSSDLVHVNVLVIAAAVSVFVELDIIVDAFVSVSVDDSEGEKR